MSDNLAIAGFAVGLAGTAGTAFGLRQSGKHHNVNTSWTEKTFEQDKHHHNENTSWTEKTCEQDKRIATYDWQLQRASSLRDRVLQRSDMVLSIMEASKESDRDMWEHRTERL